VGGLGGYIQPPRFAAIFALLTGLVCPQQNMALKYIISYFKHFTMNYLTQAEIRKQLAVIDSQTRKRLRINIDSYSRKRKEGNEIYLHIPAFINIRVDHKFEIVVSDITYTFRNSKVSVTVWKDERVASQVHVYSVNA
jgi:hypothetical protein